MRRCPVRKFGRGQIREKRRVTTAGGGFASGSPANLTVTTPIPQSLNPGPPLGQASVMAPLPSPLAFVLLLFSGSVNRQQQAVIDYLIEENRRSSER